jgi:hypothetical protein
MARFTTVSVARSDGRSEYLQNGSLVPNEPPRKDETPGPDGSIDFYLKLQENDPTALDWKRKLGGMLVRDIGGPEQAGMFLILLLENTISNDTKEQTSSSPSSPKTIFFGNTAE